MRLTNPGLLCGIALIVVVGATGAAQTISIGDTWGRRGKSASVDVALSAPTTMTAALLRVEYDPAMLENPSAAAGPLLSASHATDSYAPEAGRFNVAVYPASGAPGFASLNGTLCTLRFDVKQSAPLGVSPVRITAVGAPDLPGSDLTDTAGAVVAHTTRGGHVRVGMTEAGGAWMLYH